MKKFLMLSFLMVLFCSVVSFAQTRTVTIYRSGGYANLGYVIYDMNPTSAYLKNYDVYTTVNVGPTDTIANTYVNVDIEYKDGHTQWFYDESTTDWADVGLTVDIRDIAKITYSFEVRYKDGYSEIIDVVDVY